MGGLGGLTSGHLPGGQVCSPVKWAATSNVEVGEMKSVVGPPISTFKTKALWQGSHASWKVLESVGFFSRKFQDLESHGKSIWSRKVLEISA